MKQKIFLLLVAVLLISFASAGDLTKINNVKIYDESTKTATVKDSPLGSVIVNATLNTPQVFQVGYGGTFKVAEFTLVNLYGENYADVLDGMRIINLNTGREESKLITYKYKTLGIRSNNVTTKSECKLEDVSKNGTLINNCKTSYTTVNETYDIWEPLSNFDILNGQSITIGLFTTVNKGDKYEWIPSIAGKEIPEWATWSAGLESGLLHYYSLETIHDNYSTKNLTNNNVVPFGPAKIVNGAILGAGNTNKYLSASSVGVFGGPISIQAWINLSGVPVLDSGIVGTQDPSSDVSYILTNTYISSGNSSITFNRLRNGVANGDINYYPAPPITANSSWIHVIATYDGAESKLYINGVLKVFGAFSGNGSAGSNPTDMFVIGENPQGGAFGTGRVFKGGIDEVGIWGRNLTLTEITDLYNAGAGLPFRGVTGPNITFMSQTPSNINGSNGIGTGVWINYSIQNRSASQINYSSVNLTYKLNSTGGDFNWNINGTVSAGYIALTPTTNTSSNYSWFLDDHDVYPAVYNLDPHLAESTAPTNYTSQNTRYLKTRLFNVSNTTFYGWAEISAVNTTPTANPLSIIYCNESYTTGTVTASPFCATFGTLLPTTPPSHCHGGGECDYAIPFFLSNGSIENVKVTNTSYFLVGGAANWNIQYVSNISRVDTSQTTTNSGTTWANLSGTGLAHLHQFGFNTGINYYACATDFANLTTCSGLRSDTYELAILPPTVPTILTPTAGYYPVGNINITYLNSTTSNGSSLTYYNITLLNSDFSYNSTIVSNNGVNTSYLWNAATAGTYVIQVTANENNSLSSHAFSPEFNVTSFNVQPSSPANGSTVVSPTPGFVCLVNSSHDIINASLVFNGVVVSSNTTFMSGVRNTAYTFGYTIPSTGTHNWTCEATPGNGTTVRNASNYSVTYSNYLTASHVSPANATNVTLVPLTLIGTASDDTALLNVSLVWNGVIEQTNSSGLNATNYSFTKTLTSTGTYYWGIQACDVNACYTTNNRTVNVYNYLTVTPQSPVDTYNSSTSQVTFIAYASDDIAVLNVSLYINGVINQTNTSGVNNSNYSFTKYLGSGATDFAFVACDAYECLTTGTRTVNVDIIAPSITITSPSGTEIYLGETISTNFLNWSVTDANGLSNCWYDYNNTAYTVQHVNLPANWFDYRISTSALQSSNTTFATKSTINYLNISREVNSSGSTSYAYDIVDVSTVTVTDGWKNFTLNYTTVLLSGAKQYIYATHTNGTRIPYYTLQVSNGLGDTFYISEVSTSPQYVNCTAYNTTFTLNPYVQSLTFYANDTFGNLNSSTRTWEYKVSFLSESYENEVAETSTTTFNLSLLFDSADWSGLSARLYYNGTAYAGTASLTSTVANFVRNLDIPAINGADINQTFYWNITFTNSSGSYYVITETKNQTVTTVTFDICEPSETPYAMLWFRTYSASNTSLPINATVSSYWEIYASTGTGDAVKEESYTDITGVNSTWPFCISPNNTNYSVTLNFEADSPGYSVGNYYIVGSTYDSSTDNVTLYLLNDSLATLTELKVVDISEQPVSNVRIFIQQYDIATNGSYTVGMVKTDESGSDLAYLNWYNTWYKFVGVLDGEVIFTEGPTKISDTPKTFRYLESGRITYTKFDDVSYALYYSNTTQNFVLTYVIPSAEVTSGCLRVVKTNWTGEYTICDTCETSGSATLYCSIAGQGNGTFIGEFYATGSFWIYERVVEVIGAVNQVYTLLGETNATTLAILVAGIVLSFFLFSPVAGIVGMILGLMTTYALGFQPFDQVAFLGIVIFGGMIIWLMKR